MEPSIPVDPKLAELRKRSILDLLSTFTAKEREELISEVYCTDCFNANESCTCNKSDDGD